MKTIPRPKLDDIEILTPAEMNKIHFGGNQTPLTPEQLRELAGDGAKPEKADSGK